MLLANEDHDRLVASIYAAAVGGSPWEPVLAQVAGAFQNSASVVHVYGPANDVVHSANHGYCREHADAFYASEAFLNDPRVPFFSAVGDGEIYYDHMLYDVEAMRRNRWCRASIDMLGVTYQLGTMLIFPMAGGSGWRCWPRKRRGTPRRRRSAPSRALCPRSDRRWSWATLSSSGP